MRLDHFNTQMGAEPKSTKKVTSVFTCLLQIVLYMFD